MCTFWLDMPEIRDQRDLESGRPGVKLPKAIFRHPRGRTVISAAGRVQALQRVADSGWLVCLLSIPDRRGKHFSIVTHATGPHITHTHTHTGVECYPSPEM